jgi:hypothetical protein
VGNHPIEGAITSKGELRRIALSLLRQRPPSSELTCGANSTKWHRTTARHRAIALRWIFHVFTPEKPSMLPIPGLIFLLFFPANLCILRQVIWGQELTHQLLATGMFLFCIEQARMAAQDLQQIVKAKEQVKDSRLDTFLKITISTILIELLGFYTASIWLGWGSILILLSQVWFNLFAGVKIYTLSEMVIQPWKISERYNVLIADFLGLVLVSLWMLQIASVPIAWVLSGMAIAYCGIKLVCLYPLPTLYSPLPKSCQQSSWH